jgi:predicted SnoaL-like aldol condensation-catalyzing enzyme
MIRHEPGVRDGVAEFLRDVEVLMQHRTIDEVKLLLGQGDFVFIAAKGTHEGDPCVYINLYRVEDEKIVEHWGLSRKGSASRGMEKQQRHAVGQIWPPAFRMVVEVDPLATALVTSGEDVQAK